MLRSGPPPERNRNFRIAAFWRRSVDFLGCFLILLTQRLILKDGARENPGKILFAGLFYGALGLLNKFNIRILAAV
jgi:hypothetical protein